MLNYFSKLLLTTFLIVSLSAEAKNQALLIAISAYPSPNALPGVLQDIKNGSDIAQKLGVLPQNITVMKDKEASKEGIQSKLRALAEQATAKDQIFIYFSGHGTQRMDHASLKAGKCSEGIVTHEGKDIGFFKDADMKTYLDAIAARAAKVIVFFDSCHSGGAVTSRSLDGRARNVALRPKFIPRSAEDGACGSTINTRSLGENIQSGQNNMVFIAGAARNEVSVDIDGVGGEATSNWLSCMNNAKADTDGSGGLSAEELRRCAQGRIDGDFTTNAAMSAYFSAPQHITLVGNDKLVMAFPDQATVAAPAADPATDISQEAEATSDVESEEGSPLAAIEDLYNSRDTKWNVSLKPLKERYKIKREKVEMEVASGRDGYLYIVMAGSSNKESYFLFPSAIDEGNQIKAGQTIKLPQRGKITPFGPVGTDHLLAIVTDKPVNLKSVNSKKVGSFKSMAGKKKIMAAFQKAVTRDLGYEENEASSAMEWDAMSFGAARAEIQEVE